MYICIIVLFALIVASVMSPICDSHVALMYLLSFFTENKGPELKVGKLLQGVVKSIDKARKVVYLNPDLDMVSKFVVAIS